jgi:hypothetical protein
MDDRIFSLLFQKICQVVEALEPFTLESADIRRMWYGPRGFFFFKPEGPGRHAEMVRQALRYGTWSERFSPDYISRRLRDIVERFATEGEESAREGLRCLVSELDAYQEEHTVYVPLYGIEIADAPARTIGNVSLHQSTNEFLEGIAKNTFFDTSYVKRQTTAMAWAEVSVIAEPTHAIIRAEEQCEVVIDFLRFCMACMAPNNAPCAIGLQGDVVTKERPRIVINTASGAKTFDPHRSRLLPGFALSNQVMENIQRSPLASIADLITTPQDHLRPFDKLLLHSLHTFGAARVHAIPTDRFLNMVCVLEAFLTTGDGNITQAVSEGAVMFFCVPVDERVRLKKELQRLYKIRSKVSHGERTIILPHDLFQLEDIVKSFLGAMIARRHEFRTKDDLHRMLEQQRLT